MAGVVGPPSSLILMDIGAVMTSLAARVAAAAVCYSKRRQCCLSELSPAEDRLRAPPPNAHVGISCDANRLETPQRIMQILNLIQAKTQFLCYFWIRNSSHFAAHLVVFFLLLMERSSSKKPKALS